MGKIQLVIFDFDGTLVDTAPDLIRATNFYLEAQGLDPLPEARIRDEIGMGLRKLIRDCMPQEGMDDERARRIEGEFLATYDREFLNSPRLFDGAEEFLSDFDGRTAIVSNKRIRYIHPILEKLGLHTHPWSSIIGGDTYPNMKPHPEPFLGAMAAAGATPEETLIVGDGTPDVLGALALSIPCVAVDYGYQNPEHLMSIGAWKRIASLHDLWPLIRSIT